MQKNQRARTPEVPNSDESGGLTEDQITFVVGAGLGHTRKFVDRSLVLGVRLLWILISVGALANFVVRVS